MEPRDFRAVANWPVNPWHDPDWVSRDYHRLARAGHIDRQAASQYPVTNA